MTILQKAASVGANMVKFPAPRGKDPIAFSLFKNTDPSLVGN